MTHGLAFALACGGIVGLATLYAMLLAMWLRRIERRVTALEAAITKCDAPPVPPEAAA
jgi:hypothetical protein